MKRSFHYFAIIFEKAKADLVSEARRGYMGMLWWVVEPLLFMGVFYVIFVVLFNRGGEDAVAFLLTGLVIWKWFAISIPQCGNCIPANIGLIRQVYIPKHVFPGMVVTASTMKFLMVFMLLMVFLLITGKGPATAWLSIPLLVGVQLLMTLAIGSVLASIVPFLPDLKLIVDNGMMLLFFLSGVFFDISSVSPEMKAYLYLNPMVGIIENYRSVLLEGAWPDWLFLCKVLVVSLAGISLGCYLLHRFDRTYAKVI